MLLLRRRVIWWSANGPKTREPFKRTVDAAAMIPSTVAVVAFATAAAAVSWLGAAAVLTIPAPPLPHPPPPRSAASLS